MNVCSSYIRSNLSTGLRDVNKFLIVLIIYVGERYLYVIILRSFKVMVQSCQVSYF